MAPPKPPTTRSGSSNSFRAAEFFGPEQEAFLSAEAPVSEDVANLLAFPRVHNSKSRSRSRLRDVVGPEHEYLIPEDDEAEEDATEPPSEPPHAAAGRRKKGLRPSPWWMLCITAFSSVVTSMTFAPRTEVYIRLVCEQYKPEFIEPFPPMTNPIPLPNNDTLPPVLPSLSLARPENATQQYYDLSWSPSHEGGPSYTTVPRPTSRCTADPDVGRLVAALAAAVTLTTGILSLLTTGFWTTYSDRVGRQHVLSFVVLGNLINDVVFILTTLHASRLKGGYNMFILGAAVFGMVGGMPTSMAASQAYVADCADPTARARMFSIFYSTWFSGMAIGPTLGGLLITKTNDMLSVFYIATAGHAIVSCLVWFVLPESLSPEIIAANKSAREADALVARSAHTGFQSRAVAGLKSTFGFLVPLQILLPRKKEPGEPGAVAGTRDWNLTFIAFGHAGISSLLSVVSLKFQYAEAMFDWSSEELGYFLTGMGVLRSLHLALILPLIMKYLGPQRHKLRDAHHNERPEPPSSDPRQPLLESLRAEDRPSLQREHSLTPSHSERVDARYGHSSAHFDLLIARVSILIDFVAYLLISLSMSETQFFAASMITSFGSGFAPATQALGLYLTVGGTADAGKLFGALGMLGALSNQIVGPAIYSALYMATVSAFPKAIFVVSAGVLFTGFMAFMFVRLPHRTF